MLINHNTHTLIRLEGAILIYLGILFFLNSVFHITKMNGKEIASGSIFLSTLIILFSFFIMFGSIKDTYSIEIGSIALFFSCLYLWQNFNNLFHLPNEGIGYFCIYFFVLGVLLIHYSVVHMSKLWGIWLTVSWVSWILLLLMYYLMYVKKYNLRLFFGIYTGVVSIFSTWLPGVLLLTGKWQ